MATVAVISDTHLPRGARRLPELCLERLRPADLILHAGDLTSVALLEELEALGPPVEAVLGNVDEPALRALLPEERIVEVAGVRIGMRHVPDREERLLARIIEQHPEFADALMNAKSHFSSGDRSSPFVHIGLHLVVERGVVTRDQKMSKTSSDKSWHDAVHERFGGITDQLFGPEPVSEEAS